MLSITIFLLLTCWASTQDLIVGIKSTSTLGSCELQLIKINSASAANQKVFSYPCGPNTEGLITGISVIGNRIYWGDSTNNTILELSLQGPTVRIIASGLNSPQGIVTDGHMLYYIDRGDHDTTGWEIGAIRLEPPGQSLPDVILSNFSLIHLPRALAVRDGTLYIAGDDGVAELDLAVCEPIVLVRNQPGQVELVAEGVIVQGGNLYFSRVDGGIYSLELSSKVTVSVVNSSYRTLSLASDGVSELYATAGGKNDLSGRSSVVAIDISTGNERLVCASCTGGRGIAVLPQQGAARSSPITISGQCNRSFPDCVNVVNACGTSTPYCDVQSHECMPFVRRCAGGQSACDPIRIVYDGQCESFVCDSLGFCVPPSQMYLR